MALGILAIIFVVIAVVSGLGIAFLYLIKNKKINNALFYFLVLWALGIAYMNVSALPMNFVVQQIVGWGFGFLALAGLVIKIMKPEKETLAASLVAGSILFSMAQLFFF